MHPRKEFNMTYRRYKNIILYIIITLFPLKGLAQNTLNDAITHQLEVLEKEPDNKEALRQLSMFYLNQGNFEKSIEYANQLMEIGYATKDYGHCNLYAHICLGQAELMINNDNPYEAYNHLKQAETIGKEYEADSALCSVYNGLGLYASNIQKDYAGSLQYFFKGVEAAKRSNYKRLHGILLCNIAGIYHLQKDTRGIIYTKECYDLGHQEHDPYLSYIGAIRTASMLNLQDSHQEALKYAQEAEFLMTQNKFHDEAEVYTLYGHILYHLPDGEEEAESYFLKAIQCKEKGRMTSILYAYLGYSELLIKQKRLKEAINWLQEGLDFSQKAPSAIYRSDLILKLSECHEMNGQHNLALNYYKLYKNETDSLFNIEKERTANELRIKYNTERAENEAKQTKLELLQENKKKQTLLLILLIVLIASSLMFYIYHKKNKFYKTIVLQNQEAIRRERLLKERISSLEEGKVPQPTDNVSSPQYASSSLTEEKKSELSQALEKLMNEEHIYTDNLLTKDKVAKLLGSNRTYLSQIINEQTGKTFTQYINDYRIQDAIRILSDSNNQTPIKSLSTELGFSSTTTFYKQFQTATGMTPTQYRNQVIKLT